MTAPQEKRRPGMLQDPWRNMVAPVPEAPAAAAANVPEVARNDAGDDIDGDMEHVRKATIELKNYGGITVTGAQSPSHAAAQVLQFCVDNLKLVDQTLISFGIVVTKLHPGKLTTPFYVQRNDGWTLAVPMVKTRDDGCLQLIQAMLALRTDPAAGAKMRELKIQPYKM